MSDDGTTTKSRYWPAQGSRWWSALLIASLALNLFIGGAIATRFFTHGGPQRFIGASYTQLIPRGFFAEMPRDRRRVLLDILQAIPQGFPRRPGRHRSRRRQTGRCPGDRAL